MHKERFSPCEFNKDLCILAHGSYTETLSSVMFGRLYGAGNIFLVTEPKHVMNLVGRAGTNYRITAQQNYPKEGLVAVNLQHKKYGK